MMTEPDWETIAGQLAEEVMNLHRGSTDSGEQVWLDEKDCFAFHVEADAYYLTFPIWQPHLDIGQAMKILDAVIATSPGFDANVDKHHHSQVHEVWIVPAECRRPCWVGFHAERAKAICAAAKSWADAQERVSDGKLA